MSRKKTSKEDIIQAFLDVAFEYGAGAVSLSDVAEKLDIKKASLYNHFQSKEEIYTSTQEYCSELIFSIAEKSDDIINAIKKNKITLSVFFRKYVNYYFNLYESEPLIKVYVFIHTEKFYNYQALDIANREKNRFVKEIKAILKYFVTENLIEIKSEEELSIYSKLITSVILQQLNFYISKRKERLRQNPESGVGTLFSLPADTTTINGIIDSIETILERIKK